MNVTRYTKQSLDDELEQKRIKTDVTASISNAPHRVNMSMGNDLNTVNLSKNNDQVIIPWNQRRNPIVGREFDVSNSTEFIFPDSNQTTSIV